MGEAEANGASGPGPEFVYDPDVPLSDDERQHYAEMIRPNAAAGNAMAILACRAMKGMEALGEMLVDYAFVVEEGARLALESQEAIFAEGFRAGAAAADGGFGGDLGAEASRLFRDVVGATAPEVLEDIGDVPARTRRALMALAAHARMTLALAVILDRHSLAWEEEELVERALKLQPAVKHEADVARAAIDEFVRLLDTPASCEGRGTAVLSLAGEDDLMEWGAPEAVASRDAAVASVAGRYELALTRGEPS